MKTQNSTAKKIRCLLPAVCLAGGLTVFSAARAADVTWTGTAADNNWLNPANWSSDPNLPVEGSGTGDFVYLDTIANYAIFDATDGTRTYRCVRVGYNADGRLDVTGGTLIGADTYQHRIGRGGHSGTLNISGTGSVQAGHIAQVGIDNGSVGVVNISGDGVWQMTRGATQDGVVNTSIALGAGGTGQGTLNITDNGRVYTRFGVMVGQSSLAGSGLYHLNGGTSLSLIGGNHGANASNDGFWIQRGNGILQATIDSLNGFSLGSISIYDSGDLASYLQFDAGSTLDLGFTGAAPTSTMSWNLMTYTDGISVADNGLQLAAGDAAAGWSFGFVKEGGGVDALQITYTPVPEPTVGLLAAAGLGMLFVMRPRRRSLG